MSSKQVVVVRMSGGTKHEHIVGICYIRTDATPFVSHTLSIADAVAEVDAGDQYFTRDFAGNEGLIIVVTGNGKRYLRTISDDIQTDNMLRLPRYRSD